MAGAHGASCTRRFTPPWAWGLVILVTFAFGFRLDGGFGKVASTRRVVKDGMLCKRGFGDV
eukprot:1445430-Alexandrium_andersonii.AAC.1